MIHPSELSNLITYHKEALKYIHRYYSFNRQFLSINLLDHSCRDYELETLVALMQS